MKKNILKEEIERSIELMGLPVNEDFLGTIKDIAKKAYNKVSSFFSDDEKDKEEEKLNKDDEPAGDINNLKKDSPEEKEFLKKMKGSLSIRDISPNSTCRCSNIRLPKTKYFIVHHTAGGGTCDSVMNVLNNRKNKKTGVKFSLGVQWIVDREGNLCQALPFNSLGFHILPSLLGPTNMKSQGVEVIANNDEDVLPEQGVTVLKLVKKLGISPSEIYGHGQVNPGHKAATEGKTIRDFIQKNYNKTGNYDFSMFGDRAPKFK